MEKQVLSFQTSKSGRQQSTAPNVPCRIDKMIDFSKFQPASHSTTDDPLQAGGPAVSSPSDIPPALRHVPAHTVTVDDSSRVVVQSDPQGIGADRFRYLRLKLREHRKSRKLQTIVVTSALPLDGKSTTALNLATALAEGGRRSVLCVEADLHHPTLARTFGIEAATGFAHCLHDNIDPLSVLHRIDPPGWYLMPAGIWDGNPTELLHLDTLPGMLDVLTPHFDWILFDTPPILALTDTVLLSGQVDGTLLIVRANKTPRELVEEALRLIGQKRTLGIVLNGAEDLGEGL